jgi:3',5'-cyclic AMP phosphodiesterase CpdA
MTTLLAQVTDTHIREPGRLAYGRLNTAPYLAAAVAALMKLPQKPDALLLTGDLTDFGRVAEYEHLAELLGPLDIPYYLLPGNHDDRDNMRRCFPTHAYMGGGRFIQYSVTVGGIRIVALDSAEHGQSAGRLCASRLAWLAAELEHDQVTPTVIAIHHPPFETLIGHMDKIGLLEGARDFEAIVARHPNVQRVICGHLHRTIYTSFAHTIASTAPSPAHQVCLDLQEDAASAWNLEPPGFHVHAWTGNGAGRLLTHVVPVGQFEGPYPFHENGVLID